MTGAELTELEPTLQTTGLRGAVLYYDCREDDARFCIETIRHAADLGAVCANYCELTGLRQQGERTIAAQVRGAPSTYEGKSLPPRFATD